MRTQISIAKTAAAIVGLLIALALSRDVAAQPAEAMITRASSGRLPRGRSDAVAGQQRARHMMNPGHVYVVFIAGKAGLSASI